MSTTSTTRRLVGTLAVTALLATGAAGSAHAATTHDGRAGGDDCRTSVAQRHATSHASTRAAATKATATKAATSRTTATRERHHAAATSSAATTRTHGTVTHRTWTAGTGSTGTGSPSATTLAATSTSTVQLSATTFTSTAGLSPNAITVLRAINAAFPQVTDIGGLRAGADAEDHATGHALDLMVGDAATGDAIAAWLKAHASELGVHYVIWEQHIWNTQRDAEGWRLMPDRGSATANHYDHVHVSVN